MDKERMKDLPPSERPYEKFLERGVGALSDAEVLAMILRSGVKGTNITKLCTQIIELCNTKGGIGYLGRVNIADLMAIEGIGRIKAAQIICVGEFCTRMWKQNRGNIRQYKCANDIASYYNQYIKSIEREETFIILFDGRNHIINTVRLSIGSINASILSSRDVCRVALSYNASGIILLHNHPSGDPTPSREDKLITSQIFKAGQIIDIPLLDHIILSDGHYYSFKENGYL